jgi:uroporphyrinogen-III synthase
VIRRNASEDPRFQFFNELPEDQFQAFLSVPILCRGRVVGVINVQHRLAHIYKTRQIRLISTIGFLAGAVIELARLEGENLQLAEELETRKVVERAKGILQRDLKLTEEEAYLTLQRESRQRRKPMRDVAEAILLADELHRPASADLAATE